MLNGSGIREEENAVQGKELPASVVRTVVPLLVAWLASVLPAWLGLTGEQLSTAVAAVIGAVWYVAARLGEVYVAPWIGRVMLGGFGAPTYLPRHRSSEEDGGWARPGWVAALGAVAVLTLTGGLVAGDARAEQPDHRTLAGVALYISRATECRDEVTVNFIMVNTATGSLMPEPGPVLIQVRGVGAWAGPEGRWVTPERLPAGEGQARARVDGLPYWHGARIVLPDSDGQVASWAALTVDDCGTER